MKMRMTMIRSRGGGEEAQNKIKKTKVINIFRLLDEDAALLFLC